MPVSVLTHWSVIKCVFIHHPAWLRRHTFIVLVCPHTHTQMGSVWLWLYSSCDSVQMLHSGFIITGLFTVGREHRVLSAQVKRLERLLTTRECRCVCLECVCVCPLTRVSKGSSCLYSSVWLRAVDEKHVCMHVCVFAHGCICERLLVRWSIPRASAAKQSQCLWTNRSVISKVNLPRPAHFPKKALSSLYYMRIALHVCVLSSLKYWIVIKVAATQLSFSIKLTNCKLENSFFPVIIFKFLHICAALHSRLFSFFKLMLYIFWPYLM